MLNLTSSTCSRPAFSRYDRHVSTRSALRDDFERLGVHPGDLLMLHASMRSVGAIVGGVNVLVQALFDVVGPSGTLAAYVDFESFYEEDDESTEIPVFDKRIAHAARDHGVLHETLRNWPGIQERSSRRWCCGSRRSGSMDYGRASLCIRLWRKLAL